MNQGMWQAMGHSCYGGLLLPYGSPLQQQSRTLVQISKDIPILHATAKHVSHNSKLRNSIRLATAAYEPSREPRACTGTNVVSA